MRITLRLLTALICLVGLAISPTPARVALPPIHIVVGTAVDSNAAHHQACTEETDDDCSLGAPSRSPTSTPPEPMRSVFRQAPTRSHSPGRVRTPTQAVTSTSSVQRQASEAWAPSRTQAMARRPSWIWAPTNSRCSTCICRWWRGANGMIGLKLVQYLPMNSNAIVLKKGPMTNPIDRHNPHLHNASELPQ